MQGAAELQGAGSVKSRQMLWHTEVHAMCALLHFMACLGRQGGGPGILHMLKCRSSQLVSDQPQASPNV
jgi:hypothetical protein